MSAPKATVRQFMPADRRPPSSDERAAIATRDAVEAEETHGWEANVERGLGLVFSAADLMATELPEPRFAVPGIIPEGLSIFAGAPKLGKSWLMLSTAVAIAAGGRALGSIPVEQGDVLYLALEDNARRLQDRVRLVIGDDPAPARLQFSTRWPRLDDDRALGWLNRWAERSENPRLLIVDTLAKVRGRTRSNAPLYELDYAAVDGLKRLADDDHLAVVVVHHTRKAEAADSLDEVSGSTGLTGAADAVLVLKRERGRAEAVLKITGRDVIERELAVKFDPARASWGLVGDAETALMSPERANVLDLLARHPSLAPKQVATALDRPHEATKKLLQRMFRDGEVSADGNGRYSLHPLRRLSPSSPESPEQTAEGHEGSEGQPLAVPPFDEVLIGGAE